MWLYAHMCVCMHMRTTVYMWRSNGRKILNLSKFVLFSVWNLMIKGLQVLCHELLGHLINPNGPSYLSTWYDQESQWKRVSVRDYVYQLASGHFCRYLSDYITDMWGLSLKVGEIIFWFRILDYIWVQIASWTLSMYASIFFALDWMWHDLLC